MQLRKIRAKCHMELIPFAKRLEISRSTLTRIEAAERKGKRHPVSLEMIERITEALGELLGRDLAPDELEGIELAPPRSGRPKKKASENV